MTSLADALASLDGVEREISELHPKELRDAIRGYAEAQRKLIKALVKFDRMHQLVASSRRKPNLLLVQ
jgi:hypothetical protein